MPTDDHQTETATRLLSPEETAERLGLSKHGLRRWRDQDKGPAYIRVGERVVRYRESDLDEWLDRQVVRPTG